ncbi:phosphotransferase family protein [Rhodococcus sp. D2-41]|uniref:phosphotransferase family protein n=1 Tax=Speluncibacter jeojiensis TaxID=2710754 RepID=UPI00240FB3CC|nr:phosphotransferase family protein [Rhodococcus sp. D2-41]MDG3010151.1 phosphotransferase family protein [Rhodococcus sp. D2-41]
MTGADSVPGVDAAVDLEALGGYLREQGVVFDGNLHATRLSGGKSNLTFRLTDDGDGAWVLRRPPLAGLTPSAHDMAREYRVTHALQGTEVPVAPTVALCDDDSVLGAPFTVMGFVDGTVIRAVDDVAALSDTDVAACTEEMIGVLAALHRVDYRAVGLGEFGRPEGYLERQATRWLRQWDHVATEELPDVERLGTKLLAAVPHSSGASLVHGDYRIDNVMLDPVDPGRILAVVDWELSTLGDPLADVAMMCAYRAPELSRVLGFPAAWTDPAIPDTDDLAHRYSLASGSTLAHWDFHLALAYFKIGVVAAGIAHRTRSGAAAGADDAAGAVPEYMRLGLRALEGKEK